MRRARSRRNRHDRGSALLITVILLMVMLSLSATYAYTSFGTERMNNAEMSRYRARLTAISGLSRALAELNASAGGGCGHTGTGNSTTYSCWGNVDGNVNDTRVAGTAPPVANLCCAGFQTAVPTTGAGSIDAYDLDHGVAGQDGYLDFKGQSSATPGQSISPAELNGNYTVRAKYLGTQSNGIYTIYQVRAYGVWGREVAGVEAIVATTPSALRPFGTMGAFASNSISASSGLYVDSFQSGWPVASSQTFAGSTAVPTMANSATPLWTSSFTPAVAASLASQGGIGIGSGGSVSGSVSVLGSAYGFSAGSAAANNQPLPSSMPTAVTIPAQPTTPTVTTATLSGTVAATSGTIVASNVSNVTFSPAAGQTITVWVTSSFAPGTIVINQPAGISTGTQPGQVVFYLAPNVCNTQINVADWNKFGIPAALQIYSNGPNNLNFSSSGYINAAIDMLPSGQFNAASSMMIFGAVAASQISSSSTGFINYDLSLANLVVGTSTSPVYRVFSLIDVAHH